jgi:hypothetical protein
VQLEYSDPVHFISHILQNLVQTTGLDIFSGCWTLTHLILATTAFCEMPFGFCRMNPPSPIVFLSRRALKFEQALFRHAWPARTALIQSRSTKSLGCSHVVRILAQPLNPSFRRTFQDGPLGDGARATTQSTTSNHSKSNYLSPMLARTYSITRSLVSWSRLLVPGMIFTIVLFVGGGYLFYESHCDTVPITGRKRWLWYNGEYDEEIGHFEVSFLLRQVSCSFTMLRDNPSFSSSFSCFAQVMSSRTIGNIRS